MDETGFGNQTQQPKMQPQVQTVSVKTISWSRVIITVLVIIVVTAVIAGAYWFFILNKDSDTSDLTGPVPKSNVTPATPSATPSTQKDDISDWRTYKSGEFIFKYPPNWKLQKEDLTNNDLRLNSPNIEADIENVINVKKGSMIRFFPSEEYTSNKTLLQYVKDKFKTELEQKVAITTSTNLGGEGAVRLDSKLGVYGTSASDFISSTIYIVNNDKLYKITRLYLPGKQSEHKDTFNQILSTFKFLD